MAKFCENCGSPLKEGYKFCENCGAPVKDYAAAVTNVTAAPASASATDAGAAGATIAAGETKDTIGRNAAPQNAERPAPVLPEKQGGPASDFKSYDNLAQGGTGLEYEPDEDLKSMYLRYDNRLNRKPYIMRSFSLWAATMAVSIIVGVIAGFLKINAVNTLSTVVSVAAAIPHVMLTIRRLHDLNRPGWWCLGMLIPLLNIVLAIYLLFFKGTDGPNDYGPDPLG